jgi:FkbM family methyltransferase
MFTSKVMLQPKGLIEIIPPGINNPILVRANSSDIPTFRQIFLTNHYDMSLDFIPSLIVDIGANVGYSAVYFANKYKKSKIIAIEPQEYNFQILQENIKYWQQISVEKAAIWQSTNKLHIKNPSSDYWAFQMEESETGNVIAMTINELISKYNIEEISLLKMNIEGSEFQIFQGDLSWLSLTKSLWIETHEYLYPGSHRFIKSLLIKAGFLDYSVRQELFFVKKSNF